MKYSSIFKVILFLIPQLIFAQNFTLINNQATLFHLDDDINFVVIDNDISETKPIFLWCQGSLPYPLFVELENDKIFMIAGGITNFDYAKIIENYHLVIISMPKTPAIAKQSELNDSFWYSEDKIKPTDEFLQNDYLENYVNRANKVLEFLDTQAWADHSKTVVAGHSQGAKVGVAIANANPNITHLGLFSPNPFGRIDQSIRQARKDAASKRISWEEAEEQINETYDFYREIYSKEQLNSKPELIPWKSFSEPFIEELSALKIPVYIAYGTEDTTSDLCDLIPLYFIRKQNEHHLNLKRYFGMEHNFFEIDENDNPDYEKAHWVEVMSHFLEWLGR